MAELCAWIEGEYAAVGDENPKSIREKVKALFEETRPVNGDADEAMKALLLLDRAALEMNRLEAAFLSRLATMQDHMRVSFAQAVRSRVAPEASAYVDSIETDFGIALSTTATTYRSVEQSVEQEKRAVSAKQRSQAEARLRACREELHSSIGRWLKAASASLKQLVPDRNLDSVISRTALSEVLQKQHGSLSTLLSSQKLSTDIFEELVEACACATEVMTNLLQIRSSVAGGRLLEREAEIPESIPVNEWEAELENLPDETSQSPMLLNERLRQAHNLTKLLMQLHLDLHLSALEASSGMAVNLAIFTAFQRCGFLECFFRAVTNGILAAAKNRCAISGRCLNARDPSSYGQAIRKIAESLADSIQPLSEIVLPHGEDPPKSSFVDALVCVRTVVSFHSDQASRILDRYTTDVLRVVAKDHREDDPTLAQATEALAGALELCENVRLMERYAARLGRSIRDAVNIDSDRADHTMLSRLITQRQNQFGFTSGAQSVDPDTGLLTAECSDSMTSLINDYVGLEVSYLERAFRRAFEADEVSLESTSQQDWRRSGGFPSLLPLHMRGGVRVTEAESQIDEIISAKTGGSTLPDDIFFVLHESVLRAIRLGDILGLCAVLNHAQHLLSDVASRIAVSVHEATPKFISVINKPYEDTLNDNLEALTPFTLKRLVSLLPEDVLKAGKFGSAHSLPHALTNLELCASNIQKIEELVRSEQEGGIEVKNGDGREKVLLKSLESLHQARDFFSETYDKCASHFAQSCYAEIISPSLGSELKTMQWTLTLEQYRDSQSEETLPARLCHLLSALERELRRVMRASVVLQILTQLADPVVRPFQKMVDALISQASPEQLWTTPGEDVEGEAASETSVFGKEVALDLTLFPASARPIPSSKGALQPTVTALGALEFDRTVRSVISWFLERCEKNFRNAYRRLFDICDILATHSVEDLWDLFDSTAGREWSVDLDTVLRLVALRGDLHDSEKIAALVRYLKDSGILTS